MKLEQTSLSLIIGVASTAVCFSFGFFSNLFIYNGWQFFLTYTVLCFLISLPMAITALYIGKQHPKLEAHSQIMEKFAKTKKLYPFSILITAALLILLSLSFFNVSTYLLDFFDNVPALGRLNNSTLQYGNNIIMYSVLTVIFLIFVVIAVYTYKGQLDLRKVNRSLSHIALYLTTILVLLIIRLPDSSFGALAFFKTLFINVDKSKMIVMAAIYAILTNFISIAVYRSIISLNKYKIQNINLIAVKSIIYNVMFTFVLSISIYTIIGKNLTHMSYSVDSQAINVFLTIKNQFPEYYLLLEIIFITLNFLTLLIGINYLVRISKTSPVRLFSLIVPFVMAIILIYHQVHYLDFSDLFALHLIIIFMFMFDLFVFGWLYDAQKLNYEIMKNADVYVTPFFNICIRLIVPFVCLFVIVTYFIDNSLTIELIESIILFVIYIILGITLKRKFN